jgi:hypothetical protein
MAVRPEPNYHDEAVVGIIGPLHMNIYHASSEEFNHKM